jgi:hypothetical protein
MIGYRVEKLLIFMRFRGPEALNDKPEVIPKVRVADEPEVNGEMGVCQY